jgi:hypothetical protein
MDQADIRTSITSSDFWWAASAAGSWLISELAAPLIKVRLAGRSGLDSVSRNFNPPMRMESPRYSHDLFPGHVVKYK